MIGKKTQEGGDGSTNLQANNIVLNIANSGIDEKRAREVFEEMNLQVRRDYSQEAYEVASKRISEFENKLMPKMEAAENALEAFRDPSFQLLLVEAQKTAASTERPADYELLSELLLHRFQKGEDRKTRAGIHRAVEIVDDIADDALLALTASHAMMAFLPASGDINEGLNVLNGLFKKVLCDRLPVGTDWIDHLEILNVVRVQSFGGLKKIEQYYAAALAGYIDVGIEKNSDSYLKAIEILRSHGFSENILIEHTLNSKFVRLPITNKSAVENLSINQVKHSYGAPMVVAVKLNDEQKSALYSIWELYSKDQKLIQENVSSFMGEWNKRPYLKALGEWWNNISTCFEITSIGKVLAHSNAQRCDKTLPPLD